MQIFLRKLPGLMYKCTCEGTQTAQTKGRGQGHYQQYKFICTGGECRTFQKWIDGTRQRDQPYKMADYMRYPCGKEVIQWENR